MREEETRFNVDGQSVVVLPDRPNYTSYMADKDKAAQELGRRGGLKGGKARAEKLSDERKSEIAREAAKARWAKKRREQEESEETP